LILTLLSMKIRGILPIVPISPQTITDYEFCQCSMIEKGSRIFFWPIFIILVIMCLFYH